MGRRITLLQGHPDPAPGHYCQALADAYAEAARAAGHEIRRIDIANLDVPLLLNKDEFEHGAPVECIRVAQDAVHWCDHLVLIYPLWLGMMPARLKVFLEQLLRPGFSHRIGPKGLPERLLKGRSARIVITMGMPALAYRWFFGAHSLKALRRNVLWFCGFGPIRQTLIGKVESHDPDVRNRGMEQMRALGRTGL